MIRALGRWAREAWSGQANDYRQLQETRIQMERQQQYITEVILGAKAAEVRVRQIWERELYTRHCLKRWHEVYLAHCRERWAQAKGVRQIVPIRREATA